MKLEHLRIYLKILSPYGYWVVPETTQTTDVPATTGPQVFNGTSFTVTYYNDSDIRSDSKIIIDQLQSMDIYPSFGYRSFWHSDTDFLMHDPLSNLNTDCLPDRILKGLYLGGINAAFNRDYLLEQGVKSVLTVSDQFYQPFKGQFFYSWVNIVDLPDQNLFKHFDSCTAFIDERIKEGSVLVHCQAGLSRSPSIVVAYLMKYKKLPFKIAMTHVKLKRSIIAPNAGFLKQLEDYEKFLLTV